MKDTYIDIRNENDAIRKEFDNKHLVSVEELLNKINNLRLEIEHLEEKIEDIEQDIQDNYRPVSIAEQVGYNEND